MLTDETIACFDAAYCRPGLRLRAHRMIRTLLDEDAADRWNGDSLTPDDLAGLVPPPRDLWRVDDAKLSRMLQDFAVMGVFAIHSGQFDDRSLLEPLMDLQSAACAVAGRCDSGRVASVIPFPSRDPAAGGMPSRRVSHPQAS